MPVVQVCCHVARHVGFARPKHLQVVVAELRRDHRQTILLEEYIEGDELTVGMYGNDPPRILGIMRVRPKQPAQTVC